MKQQKGCTSSPFSSVFLLSRLKCIVPLFCHCAEVNNASAVWFYEYCRSWKNYFPLMMTHTHMHTHCGQFICQAVICFPLNGLEVMMKMIKINHLSRLCYSVTWLIRALSSFILLLPPPHFAPLCPSPVPCLHLLYCFLSSHPPSFHHPHALRPPSLSSSFPPSSLQIFNPHSSPLPALFSPIRYIMVLTL